MNVRNWDIRLRQNRLRFGPGSVTIFVLGVGFAQEAHREIRSTDACGRGPVFVARFGGRAAIRLRGARRSLHRGCAGLCGAGRWSSRAALRGTGSRIRSTGLWGTGLWGTGLRCAGARLPSSRNLWSPRISLLPTTDLYRAGAGLFIRLCGRICTEAARRHSLHRRPSLRRESGLWSMGILQLKCRAATPTAPAR